MHYSGPVREIVQPQNITGPWHIVRSGFAKGVALLGLRAVLVESYERIHRSNLIGMGVAPQRSTF